MSFLYERLEKEVADMKAKMQPAELEVYEAKQRRIDTIADYVLGGLMVFVAAVFIAFLVWFFVCVM